jgi:hypothetical protein
MAKTETNGEGRPANAPGVYRHKETGKELIARRHRKFGDSQADGFVQAGYEWVGPEPKVTKETKQPEVKAIPQAEKTEVKPAVELPIDLLPELQKTKTTK